MQKRAMDKMGTRTVLAVVFAAVSLWGPAALAQVPGVDPITDTVKDTVDSGGSTVNDTVDDTTDEVDDASGGSTSPVTDTVDGTVDDTTKEVSGGTNKIVDSTKDTVDGTVDEVDKATGGTVGSTTDTVDKTLADPANRLENPLGFRDTDGDGKVSKKERQQQTQSGDLTRAEIAALREALAQERIDARIAALMRREGAHKTAPLGFDEVTVPTASPESVFAQFAEAASEAAKKLAFPLALTLMVLAYLVVQGRIDGRDEKLALAPIDADQDLLSFS